MRMFVLVVCCLVSGCGAVYAPSPMQDGHIAIMSDSKGMRAFMDGMNGFITNGKASPDKATAHWNMRQVEEKEITVRATRPSILDGLFTQKQEEPATMETN